MAPPGVGAARPAVPAAMREGRALPRKALTLRFGGLLAALLVLAGCAGPATHTSPPPTGSARQRAIADARDFLGSNVASDGRVVRHDQGGDTVSEGQGYGMLLALAANDRAAFTRIWSWTHSHLQEKSGLFAYHWPSTSASDRMPAADADTQIAWALDLAGGRWHDQAWTAAAKQIAEAVAGAEVGYDDQGHPTLSGGPWAVPHGRAVIVEPGYWTFPADQALGALTGDHRWLALSPNDAQHLIDLTGNGSRLPADWAQVGGGHAIVATAHPSGTPVVSGQDGLRALVWADCSSATRGLETGWWRLVRSTATKAPLSRSLTGHPASSDQAPLSDVAAAAAAAGAGDATERDRLLAAADRLERRFPTYYGLAWVALGRVLLTTDLLTPDCEVG